MKPGKVHAKSSQESMEGRREGGRAATLTWVVRGTCPAWLCETEPQTDSSHCDSGATRRQDLLWPVRCLRRGRLGPSIEVCRPMGTQASSGRLHIRTTPDSQLVYSQLAAATILLHTSMLLLHIIATGRAGRTPHRGHPSTQSLFGDSRRPSRMIAAR